MTIPVNQEELKTLAQRAKAGLTAIGPSAGVVLNTADNLTTDYEHLMGDPATPGDTGTQGAYNKKSGELTDAQTARVAAIAASRALAAKAVDTLKAHLGRVWNPRWAAAGFRGSSIAIKDPEVGAKLEELRNYFRDNPTREVTSEGITAAACEASRAALIAAVHARDAAKGALQAARNARDASFRQLKARLSGLQEELGQLLRDDDDRWAHFGFPRPIDGPMPDRVKGVIVTPGGPGALLVQWQASPRALNYRVSWQLTTSGAPLVEVGLLTDLAANLSGLPSGATIRVLVTARNIAGETAATEASIVVP
jgi:hypothetical protein